VQNLCSYDISLEIVLISYSSLHNSQADNMKEYLLKVHKSFKQKKTHCYPAKNKTKNPLTHLKKEINFPINVLFS